MILGSVADGCSLAKWFSPDARKHEIEIDIQHIFGSLHSGGGGGGGGANPDDPDDAADLLVAVSGPTAAADKPDNVKIKLNKERLRRRLIPKAAPYIMSLTGEFVDPREVRRMAKDILKYKDNDGTASMIICAAFAIPKADVSDHVQETTKGTAFTINIVGEDKHGRVVTRASVDNVPALRCRFWPQHAMAFLDMTSRRCSSNDAPRHVAEPDENARAYIVNEVGCDIVPKSSQDGDKSTEWRWSFSRAETYLMDKYFSPEQKRTYYVCKIIFYKHLKPLEDALQVEMGIYSYWAKTTMLWMCEEFPRTDEIWRPENLLNSIRQFFIEFLGMIDSWNMPHYFLPQHSLLRYHDQRALQEPLVNRLQDMVFNTENYLPDDKSFRDAFERLRPQRDALKTANGFVNKVGEHLDEFVEALRKIRNETDLIHLLRRFDLSYLKDLIIPIVVKKYLQKLDLGNLGKLFRF